VTTIVPKGRGPFVGPDAFVDGAIDALKIEGFPGSTDWSIARTLFRLEGFNGYGYHPRGVNSPYLYGGSTVYGPPEARAGKFVADHVFDANVVDKQLGTAVILKALMELDPSIHFDGVSPMPVSTDPDDDLAQTVLHVQQSLNKLGADPQLVEDGKNGPRTKAAISQFQQHNGLTDTGLPDAATIAAIAVKSQQTVDQTQPPIRRCRSSNGSEIWSRPSGLRRPCRRQLIRSGSLSGCFPSSGEPPPTRERRPRWAPRHPPIR
jgi:hypothetical protein